MSSMRNAVQRRNHKERAQPIERKRWGLLEKHKDYALRAADHNAKKRKIKALRQKASERNEDEFYFGMMSSTSAGGIKRAKRGEENGGSAGKGLRMETVKLMKTQDEGYLRTVLQGTRKLRERVEREVVGGEVGVQLARAPGVGGRKVVFVEDGEDVRPVPMPALGEDDDEVDMDGFTLDEESGAADEDEKHETERLSKAELSARRRRNHALAIKRRQLDALRDREEQLTVALREVEAQRARMSGTVGGVNKNGVKFKARQRKR